MKTKSGLRYYLFGLVLLLSSPAFSKDNSLGIFDAQTDIGQIMYQGAVFYHSGNEEYEIRSPATNITTDKDPIHFVWKRMKGDFKIYAELYLSEEDTALSGKLGCMVRTSLDTNSTYINGFVDKGGLTSVQYKKNKSDSGTEIQSAIKHANVIQLERNDNTFIIRFAKFGEPFITEEVKDLNFDQDVYVGLFIGSRNENTVKKVLCRNIRITIPVPSGLAVYRTDIGSNLELLDIATGSRKIIYTDTNSIHAPIWKKDGKTIIYGKQGFLYAFDLANKMPQLINTGREKSNSNDHVLSGDGETIAYCIAKKEKGGAIIHIVPAGGGEPKLIGKKGPSYPHGWSPDNKYVLFSGSRKGEFEIYKMRFNGGREIKITNTPGMDDCPEYSPDGKFIYFISNRTGAMCVWRMNADGKDQQQLTTGEYNDWFPHVSPNGKWILFLSYSKDDASASGHPSYRNVYLRLMPATGGQPKVIAYFYGGHGSINSPCWSPDSKTIAFASYSDTQY